MESDRFYHTIKSCQNTIPFFNMSTAMGPAWPPW